MLFIKSLFIAQWVRPARREITLMKRGSRRRPGQATVEFAFASMIFLLFVFGTIDFGRAIFITADLHNAAREGSRYGSLHPTDCAGMQSAAVAKAVGTGLTTAGVTASCPGSGTVSVTVSISFKAVTQMFLGIPALTLHATSNAEVE
jgi:Flp pilus assembly protein TadG